MENQGFPTICIEKIMMKFLKKNLNPKRIGGTIWIVLPDLKRKKMGIKYDKTTGLPSNDNTDYNTLLEMWRDEKKRRQEVEGENTIIKGIGNNSPEMKALKKENEELKAALAREKEDREYDNLVHKRELADLFKGKYEKE